jgi:hypothetical protein
MVSPPVLEPSPIVPVSEEEERVEPEDQDAGSTLKPNEDAFNEQFGEIVVSTEYNLENPVE